LTDFKWAQWAKPWDSGSAQPAFKQIVAGNQQGYVVKIDPNVTTNASALQITDIAFDQATGLATLKIMNHTLGDDTSDNMDVIKLLNCTIDITVTAGGALVESKNIDDFYEMSIAGVNTANNFNQPMATAGKITIAEVEELVPAGELDPNQIHTPGVYVQRIFKAENLEKRIEFTTTR